MCNEAQQKVPRLGAVLGTPHLNLEVKGALEERADGNAGDHCRDVCRTKWEPNPSPVGLRSLPRNQ
eukprot:NODE_7970_length_409_cov_1.714689.p2 GENE.NODE_7970_length_409_cov_1.714689~~NODE_7970_length_409_cov_1.714689.p2  ORF type:complete len:66 (-),score=1.33 NODE_7970_length_409_cov_1.714689:49-246(-)